MKTGIKISILIITVLFSFGSFAQSSESKDLIISWENGNVTLLKDLGKVWIDLKKGNTIKKAQLWEVKPSEGKIVYEKDGSLHDMLIANINAMYAGENSMNELYFDMNNNPRIRKAEKVLNEWEPFSDFKVSYHVSSIKNEKKISEAKNDSDENAAEKAESEWKYNSSGNDTLVKPSGEIVLVKMISMTETEIRYKRSDLPSGPVYVLNIDAVEEIIKNEKSIKIVLKTKN